MHIAYSAKTRKYVKTKKTWFYMRKSFWIYKKSCNKHNNVIDNFFKQNYIHHIFSGASKICYYNDKYIVFKVMYDFRSYGNQIETEIKLYNLYHEMFSDILPIIYKSWNNTCMVEERCTSFEELSLSDAHEKFKQCTGVSYVTWNTILQNWISGSDVSKAFSSCCKKCYNKLKKYSDCNNWTYWQSVLQNFIKKHSYVGYEKLWKYLERIFKTRILTELFVFAMLTKASLVDMQDYNLGLSLDGKQLKLLDYGV